MRPPLSTAAHAHHRVLAGPFVDHLARRTPESSGAERYVSVEVFGLYWHFVDVVWIILFTFIYFDLSERMQCLTIHTPTKNTR
jgi:heme/copper-type cytochrome/quinol oxidase subunit 3